MKSSKRNYLYMGIFLLVEAVLYYGILSGSPRYVECCYGAILLCFIYGLLHCKTANFWILAGMACTVAADYFLVLFTPAKQLWGMIFFLIAQSMYAAALHTKRLCKPMLVIRFALTAVAPLAVFIFLKDKTDLLSVISVCYYVNLIMNLIAAWTQGNRMLGIAFVLFLLCDTVVGLQVAAMGYLPIEEGTLLYRMIYANFNFVWFFYLPSQVLIAIGSRKK